MHAEDGFVFCCQLHPVSRVWVCVLAGSSGQRREGKQASLDEGLCLAFVHISLMRKGLPSCSSLLAPAEPQWEREFPKGKSVSKPPPKRKTPRNLPTGFLGPQPRGVSSVGISAQLAQAGSWSPHLAFSAWRQNRASTWI